MSNWFAKGMAWIVVVAALTLGKQAVAQVNTIELTGSTPGLSAGSFSINSDALDEVDVLNNTGPVARQYYSVFFTPSSTQQYTFGQTFSSVDTVMFMSTAVFDPSNPGNGAFVFNDDSSRTSHVRVYGSLPADFGCGETFFCPQVEADLEAGKTYSIVVTTYDESNSTTLPLPQKFYAVGPGTFTASAPVYTPPTAPTNLVATAGDGQVSVAFSVPNSDGGSSITDYEYQLDGGSWLSGSTTSSPVVIAGLTNGTSYSVKIRAVNTVGSGAESDATTTTPIDTTRPSVTLTSTANALHSGVFSVTATFSEAVTGFTLNDMTIGNGSISNFQATSATVYTFDVTPTADGAVTVDIAADVAVDAATNGNTAATQLSVTTDNTDPVVTISGPTEVVVDDFTVTLTFSEAVTGFAAEDITVTNGEKGTFTETTPGKVYTLVVTPELGTTVAVSVSADKAQDAAGNGNEASDVFEVSAGSPASEFEGDSANIKQDIVTEVQNTLQNAVTANARMVKEAKSRFITSTRSSLNGTAGFAGQNNVPFDVDGVANGTAMRLSTNGTFFGQVGNDEGTKRRVFSGDFSIVGEKGGSVTGSISGKVAWEQNLSDKTMYGYFIGAQVNQTDIKTTYSGKQQGYGVNIGSYVVNEVAENVYIDGFVSLGMGKSDLDMSNDVLSLDGSYETKSATIGGALTGVYDMESYEFWPELAFTAGKTQVGTAKFTGRAYGLVDNNLSLDAGDVTVANLTLRPEVRIPLEAGNQSGATSQVTFAPRAICERIKTDVTTENCGRGAELGFIRRSGDGLTQITGRLSRDYVGTSTRTGLELKLEHRF